VRVDELASGDGSRVGSCYRIEWRSRIRYSVEFEFTVQRVEDQTPLEGRGEGDLIGLARVLGVPLLAST
jgi:hypothetical protein